MEVHWRYEAWVTGKNEVLITWVTSMRYEGGVHKRQLAEVHASKPGTKSMVQRPRMRCEHTCDPADPTFCGERCPTCSWRDTHSSTYNVDVPASLLKLARRIFFPARLISQLSVVINIWNYPDTIGSSANHSSSQYTRLPLRALYSTKGYI